MKTKHEIIDETAGHYRLGFRSVEDGDCSYADRTSGTGGCAFGRCCIDPEFFSPMEGSGVLGLYCTFGRAMVEERLKTEYRGHCVSFWEDLQGLHDTERFWSEDGLSEAGRDYVSKLKEKWLDD